MTHKESPDNPSTDASFLRESRLDRIQEESLPSTPLLTNNFLREFSSRTPQLIGTSSARHSAVCIPLIARNTEGSGTEYDILFTVRSSKIGSQPGDVCFPGGKLEEDEQPSQAAMREAMEELMIQKDQMQIIGPSDIFHTSSLYVHPFLCLLSNYQDTFSSDEVAEVFRVPLQFFMDTKPDTYTSQWHVELPTDFPYDKIYGGKNYAWRKREEEILFYEYQGHVIWGMTARILYAFVQMLKAQ